MEPGEGEAPSITFEGQNNDYVNVCELEIFVSYASGSSSLVTTTTPKPVVENPQPLLDTGLYTPEDPVKKYV